MAMKTVATSMLCSFFELKNYPKLPRRELNLDPDKQHSVNFPTKPASSQEPRPKRLGTGSVSAVEDKAGEMSLIQGLWDRYELAGYLSPFRYYLLSTRRKPICSPERRTFVALMNLAWAARARIPVIIFSIFSLFNLPMVRIEVNINMHWSGSSFSRLWFSSYTIILCYAPSMDTCTLGTTVEVKGFRSTELMPTMPIISSLHLISFWFLLTVWINMVLFF